MAIGDYYKHLGGKIHGTITPVFGTLDLHTHIRLKPVLKYMKNNILKCGKRRIIEVGCGAGTVAFELPKISDVRQISYVGFDLDPDSIGLADKIAKALNVDDCMKFVCADATSYAFDYDDHLFDTVLLIDFLEHVRNPSDILRNLKSKVKKNGLFVVSVPTHHYRSVFGRDYHERVGHVVDGFTLPELKHLFDDIGARILYTEYNTGLISSLGCALSYRLNSNIQYLSIVKNLMLYPFRFLDMYNSERVSCSLFAVFQLNGRLR